ncbi:tripartite tricarboxylate transporter TctB family protein [Tranquillimonas alkanivorans]|uniref:Tripartite tricarboxylate transporter TctB family protein n=1 Tax=Tranquillimonas alkanivorans TaxID=441119 RepID=A0A1I5VV09_9RHOB|nr:tripartite tricarboxylate transporter TctB family protein [Tranquillimonas alkanivorans]SFQ11281.1 Tripartite tricarboxylate transporter TctB family protein [Tranquillimonas alkanivorans]
MGDLTQVTIDFETSHLVFPTIIGIMLALLGLAILITRRHEIAHAGAHWRGVFDRMDKVRFLGTIGLTVLYFSLMVPVGNVWPNTGLGFLICSIPYVLLTGLLFMHDRRPRKTIPVVVTALVAPTLVWWLFTDLFFLTLP